jgi:hypothetical protein
MPKGRMKDKPLFSQEAPLEFHELANRFELMDERQFARFKERLKKNGYMAGRPIVMHEGKILDGRNRYRACRELNIKPSMKTYAGEYGDPWNYVLVQNADRCHYSEGALALLAAAEHKYNGYSHGGKRSTDPSKWTDGPLETLAETAERHGMSAKKVARAQTILDAAEEVKQLVVENKVSITDAAKVAKEAKEVQREAAEKVRNGKARTLASAAGKGDAWEGQPDEVAAALKDCPFLDKRGAILPAHLEAVFTSPLFAACLGHLREARRAIAGIALHSPFQPKPAEIAKQLKDMADLVEANLPFAICVRCEGAAGAKCDACRRAGWVPAWRHDELMIGMEVDAADSNGVHP